MVLKVLLRALKSAETNLAMPAGATLPQKIQNQLNKEHACSHRGLPLQREQVALSQDSAPHKILSILSHQGNQDSNTAGTARQIRRARL